MSVKSTPVAASTSTPAPSSVRTPADAGIIMAPRTDVRTLAAAFCRAYKVHPATKDKTPKGLASKVAVGLNRALGHTSCQGNYWTGADVLAFCAAEGITLG